jgi:hypothetical protein
LADREKLGVTDVIAAQRRRGNLCDDERRRGAACEPQHCRIRRFERVEDRRLQLQLGGSHGF